MGFDKKASAPASRPLMRLFVSVAIIVIKIIGICFVALLRFSLLQTSKPSISGIIISSNITSGCCSFASLIPSLPDKAVMTLQFGILPFNSASNEIRLSILSSIARIFFILFFYSLLSSINFSLFILSIRSLASIGFVI